MIQRIQTIFLLLAVILGGLYIYSPVIELDGALNTHDFIRAYQVKIRAEGYFFFVLWISAGIAMGANLLSIFLYKFPTIQKLFSLLSILNMLFCFGYVYYLWSTTEYKEDTMFYYGNITPMVIVLLNLLAIWGISKDENLLKSYDRLR